MSTEDKKVDAQEDSTLKKMKIRVKKELKRAKDKGERLAKKYGPTAAAAALTIGGASLNVTEAEAQTRVTGEIHISSNGTQTYTNYGSSGGRTASFTQAQRQYQRTGAVRQQTPMQQADAKLQAAADYMRTYGMVIDAELSRGLRQEYLITRDGTKLAPIACAAYFPEKPNDIYFIRTDFRNKLSNSCIRSNCEEWQRSPSGYAHVLGNAYLGGRWGAPSAFVDFFASQGVPVDYGYGMEAGYGRPVGGVYGDEWDRALDEINHTMDQVDYAIGTAARVGETVAGVLHMGNKIGGRIKREVNRGMGKAPSGRRMFRRGR